MQTPHLLGIHPIGLVTELANMPQAYRAMTGDMVGNMQAFYQQEIKTLGGTQPPPDADLDAQARALIETRFPDHPTYYGYFPALGAERQMTDAVARMVGILPTGSDPVRGTILDVRGYGHVFEYDLERTAAFVNAGFAVFTPDRLEHGLSSRIDPRNDAFHSTQLFVENTRQATDITKEIRREDKRLSPAPFYALASSLGGAQLLGAMGAAQSSFGIEALVLDSPLLTFGSKHPWVMRRVTALLFGALATFPETLSEVKAFYPKRSQPARLPKMTDALFDRVNRYSHAFGPRYHPIVMRDLENLLARNERWLANPKTQWILPRTMMHVAQSDTELDPPSNIRLFRKFARRGDALRETNAHNAFVQKDDPHLVPDIIDFFEGRRADAGRVFEGAESMSFFPWPRGNWI